MNEERRSGVRYYWDEKNNEIHKFECYVSQEGPSYIYNFYCKTGVHQRWTVSFDRLAQVVNRSIYFLGESNVDDKLARTMFQSHFISKAKNLRKKADEYEKSSNTILTATIVSDVKEV